MLLKKSRDKFDKFTNERFKLTKMKYHSFEDLQNNVPIADIYIAGSDQIWNTYSQNGNDPAFYLEFAPKGSLRASYAASFSTPQLNIKSEEKVKNWLSKFDFISVREKTGLDILKKIGINEAQEVVDPVFLIEKDIWTKLAKNAVKNRNKYILVYDQENNSSIKKFARELAKKFNLKIFAIETLYPMFYANRRLKNIGPEEFLGLIQNCEICLTNSFHGLAFSLIFNKEFLLFPRTHQNVNSRMIDLLSSLDLKDKIIDNVNNKSPVKKINYNEVNLKLEKKIELSRSFIDKVLSDKQKTNA